MDNSGTQDTNSQMNSTVPVSPFAPTDLPDLNSVPAAPAMPPMGVPNAQGAQSAQGVAQANTAPSANVSSTAQTNVTSTSAMPQNKTPQAGTENSVTLPKVAVKPEAKPVTAQPTVKDVNTSASQTIQAEAPKAAGASTLKNNGLVKNVTIEALLEECLRRKASDLHLQVGLPPIVRVDGFLQPLTAYPILDDPLVQKLVFATLDEDQKKILEKDKEFDYSFAFGDLGRFRVNAFHEKGNMAAAFRSIPNEIISIEDLGLPAVIASFAEHPSGLVLITGPTGSGKSTTLAALIDRVNTDKAVHIITIEDPIEFTHRSKRSVVAQREVHYDTYSFAAALRSILREDPDVVLIGELRDLETIQAAITVAETGHLVFGTLHTNSAAQSIDRIVDVFPAHQQPQIRSQLANVLVGVCSQRLVPAIDGGRVAVAEILVANPAVRSIIREGKTHQLDMVMQTGAELGMRTMDRELARMVKEGVISYDIARAYTVDPAEFDRLARG